MESRSLSLNLQHRLLNSIAATYLRGMLIEFFRHFFTSTTSLHLHTRRVYFIHMFYSSVGAGCIYGGIDILIEKRDKSDGQFQHIRWGYILWENMIWNMTWKVIPRWIVLQGVYSHFLFLLLFLYPYHLFLSVSSEVIDSFDYNLDLPARMVVLPSGSYMEVVACPWGPAPSYSEVAYNNCIVVVEHRQECHHDHRPV